MNDVLKNNPKNNPKNDLKIGNSSVRLIRGRFLHFLEDPFSKVDSSVDSNLESKSYQYVKHGIMLIVDGFIQEFLDCADPKHQQRIADLNEFKGFKDIPTTHYPSSHLIVPGFIDTHIHYPQTEIIASYGEQLLEWLNKYTFPTESKFADAAYAEQVANFFIEELLRNGTTTAAILGTVHKHSVDAVFAAAQQRKMRVIAGKVLMDRTGFTPDSLYESAAQGYEESKKLIQKWHGKERLSYAVTPRFAITSTEEQLRLSGKLMQEFPGVYMQTHLAENLKEVETVDSLYLRSAGYAGYLDVYDHFGLLGDKSIFAHCVHLREGELERLAASNSVISFCPSSNLFLGSGLFPFQQSVVRMGLGTDVGGGSTFSLLKTMHDAYKTAQLQHKKLSAFGSFYLATLGGARALSLDHLIGNFLPGKEADFVVLNPAVTPLQQFRLDAIKNLELHDELFGMVALGDERSVVATYVMGKNVKHDD
ncbi:MAG: guanine deaminase [Oligoflexia bacterium]|nr:guanine deaminase [Oligoflexia bacterium]